MLTINLLNRGWELFPLIQRASSCPLPFCFNESKKSIVQSQEEVDSLQDYLPLCCLTMCLYFFSLGLFEGKRCRHSLNLTIKSDCCTCGMFNQDPCSESLDTPAKRFLDVGRSFTNQVSLQAAGKGSMWGGGTQTRTRKATFHFVFTPHFELLMD